MTGAPLVNYTYFSSVFTYSQQTLVSDMRSVLEGTRYDTIIGTGLSGTVFTARVAPALRKSFAILRKDDDQSTHSGNRLEGCLGKSWIFVDDFSETGATFVRVLEYMVEKHPECEFKGFYKYERGIFMAPEDLREHFEEYGTRTARKIVELVMGPVLGPKKPESGYFTPSPLTEPVGGWSKEMKPLVPVPDDCEVNWANLAGQPTFWSRSMNKVYDALEFPQFKRLVDIVNEARDLKINEVSRDGWVNRWSDEGMKVTDIARQLGALKAGNLINKDRPQPSKVEQLEKIWAERSNTIVPMTESSGRWVFNRIPDPVQEDTEYQDWPWTGV